MEVLSSKGFLVAAVVGAGALGCYNLCRLTFSKSNSKKGLKWHCKVLFFGEESGRCLTLPSHRTQDCLSEECALRHLRTVKAFLNTATASVDLCLYNLTQPDLEKTIISLIGKGIKVRCVAGTREDESTFVTKLRASGAFVRLKDKDPPPNYPFQVSDLLMHHKFVLIDNRILITGSMNWTSTSFRGNLDHILICTDRYLVQQFVSEFESLFNETPLTERSSVKRPNNDHPFQACFFKRAGLQCRVDANKRKVCGREDCVFPLYKSVLFKLTALKTLDICVQQLTLEDLAHHIVLSHENAVKVRIICDRHMAEGSGSQIRRFINEGIQVRMVVGTNTVHHKFIIVDKKLLVSGSLNWTMQSFFGNYENILFISQQDVVNEFQTQFELLWERLTPVDNENWRSVMQHR